MLVDNLQWKMSFDVRYPSMEGYHWRKAFGGRLPSIKYDLWWKITLKEDDLHISEVSRLTSAPCSTAFENHWLSNWTFHPGPCCVLQQKKNKLGLSWDMHSAQLKLELGISECLHFRFWTQNCQNQTKNRPIGENWVYPLYTFAGNAI